MKKFAFLTNKYVVSILILLCLLATDVILHRGMSRIILPESFSDKIVPVNLPLCTNDITAKDKRWVAGINSISLLDKLVANTAGFECNIVFNKFSNNFLVQSDSGSAPLVLIDSLLAVYTSKKLQSNIWFSLKNLNPDNVSAAAKEMTRLRNKHKLNNQIIIESPDPALLKSFCDSGFYTSYLLPAFNPYQAGEADIIRFADSIRTNLIKHPTSAVSATYFQYPVLKKFFPNYPILTRADHTSISVVSYVFKQQLEHDENIKVILSPFKD